MILNQVIALEGYVEHYFMSTFFFGCLNDDNN